MYQFDFTNQSVSTFNSGYGGSAFHRWIGGSIYQNFLYLLPNYDNRIMVVNLLTKSISSLSLFGTGYKNYSYSIVCNRKLFMSSPTNVLYVLDLVTNTLSSVSISNTGQLFYHKETNSVIVLPGSNDRIYHIDQTTNNITQTTVVPKTTTNSYYTGVLFYDNYLVIFPFDEKTVLVYDILNRRIVSSYSLTEQIKQRYSGFYLSRDGTWTVQTLPERTTQHVYFFSVYFNYVDFFNSKNLFKINSSFRWINQQNSRYYIFDKRKLRPSSESNFDYTSSELVSVEMPNYRNNRYLNIYLGNSQVEQRRLKFELNVQLFNSKYLEFVIEKISVDNLLIKNEYVKISFDDVTYHNLPYTDKFVVRSGQVVKIYVQIDVPETETLNVNMSDAVTLLIFDGYVRYQ